MNVIVTKKSVTINYSDGRVYRSSKVEEDKKNQLIELLEGVIKITKTLEKKVFKMFPPNDETKEEKKAEKTNVFIDFIQQVTNKEVKDFTIIDGALYHSSVPNVSIPEFLARAIAEHESRRSTLLNFWLLLAHNPDPVVRLSAFDYIQRNQLRLGKSGMLFTFRRAHRKEVRTDVVGEADAKYKERITELVYLTKEKKKASTQQFVIKLENGTIECVDIRKVPQKYKDCEQLGMLHEIFETQQKELIEEPSKEIRYYSGRSDHTKFTVNGVPQEGHTYYALHKETRIPRVDCDKNPENECSNGLHLGAPRYVSNFGSGDILVCLISPMDIVSVPNYDSSKARFCSVYPVAVIQKTELARYIREEDVFDDYDDLEYASQFAESIKARVKNSTAKELRQALTIPEKVTKVHMIKVLETYSNVIKNRIVEKEGKVEMKPKRTKKATSPKAAATTATKNKTVRTTKSQTKAKPTKTKKVTRTIRKKKDDK